MRSSFTARIPNGSSVILNWIARARAISRARAPTVSHRGGGDGADPSSRGTRQIDADGRASTTVVANYAIEQWLLLRERDSRECVCPGGDENVVPSFRKDCLSRGSAS